MIESKADILEQLSDMSKVKSVILYHEYPAGTLKYHNLKPDYSKEDYDNFLDELKVQDDKVELGGTIWFKDGTWLNQEWDKAGFTLMESNTTITQIL